MATSTPSKRMLQTGSRMVIYSEASSKSSSTSSFLSSSSPTPKLLSSSPSSASLVPLESYTRYPMFSHWSTVLLSSPLWRWTITKRTFRNSYNMGTSGVLWMLLCFGCVISAVHSASDGNVSVSDIDPSFSSLRLETNTLLVAFTRSEKVTLPVESNDVFPKERLSSSQAAENATNVRSTARKMATPTQVPNQASPLISSFSRNLTSGLNPISSFDSIIHFTSVLPVRSSIALTYISESDTVLETTTFHPTTVQDLVTTSIPKSGSGIFISSIHVSSSFDSNSLPFNELDSNQTTADAKSAAPTPISVSHSQPTHSLQETVQPVSRSSTVQTPNVNNITSALSNTDNRGAISESTVNPESRVEGISPLSGSEQNSLMSSQTLVVIPEHSTGLSGAQVQNTITSMPILSSFSRSESNNNENTLVIFTSQSLSSQFHARSVFESNTRSFVSSMIRSVSVFQSSRSDNSNFEIPPSQSSLSDSLIQIPIKSALSDTTFSQLDNSVHTSSINAISSSSISSSMNTDTSTDITASFSPHSITPVSPSSDFASSTIPPRQNQSAGFDQTVSSNLPSHQNKTITRSESNTRIEPTFISSSQTFPSSESQPFESLKDGLTMTHSESFNSPMPSQSQSNIIQNVPSDDVISSLVNISTISTSFLKSYQTELIEPTAVIRPLNNPSSIQLQTSSGEGIISLMDNETDVASTNHQTQTLSSLKSFIPNGSVNGLVSDTYNDLTSDLFLNSTSLYDSTNASPTQIQAEVTNTIYPISENSSISISSPSAFTQNVSSQEINSKIPLITSIVETTLDNRSTAASTGSINSDSIINPTARLVTFIDDVVTSTNALDNSEISIHTITNLNRSIDDSMPIVVTTMSVSAGLHSTTETGNSSHKIVSFSQSMSTFPSSAQSTLATFTNSIALESMSPSIFPSRPLPSLGNVSLPESTEDGTFSSLIKPNNSFADINMHSTSMLSIKTDSSSLEMANSTHATPILLSSFSMLAQNSSATPDKTPNSTTTESLARSVSPDSSMPGLEDSVLSENNTSGQFLPSPNINVSISSSLEPILTSISPTLIQQSSISVSNNVTSYSTIVPNETATYLSSKSSTPLNNETLSNIPQSSFIEASTPMLKTDMIISTLPNTTMTNLNTVMNMTEMFSKNHYATMLNSSDIVTSFTAMPGDVSGLLTATPSIYITTLANLGLNSTISITSSQSINDTEYSSLASFNKSTEYRSTVTPESVHDSMHSPSFEISPSPSFQTLNSRESVQSNVSNTTPSFDNTDHVSFSTLTTTPINDTKTPELIASVGSTLDDFSNVTSSFDGRQSSNQPIINSLQSSNISKHSSIESSFDTNRSEMATTINSTFSLTQTPYLSSPSLTGLESTTSMLFSDMNVTMSTQSSLNASDVLVESATRNDNSTFIDIIPTMPGDSSSKVSSLSVNVDTTDSPQDSNFSSRFLESSQTVSDGSTSDFFKTTFSLEKNTLSVTSKSSIQVDINSTRIDLHETISSKMNYSSGIGLDTMNLEITSTSSLADMESTFLLNETSTSYLPIVPSRTKINSNSTFTDNMMEESSTVLPGNNTQSLTSSLSSKGHNSNSSVDMVRSSEQESTVSSSAFKTDISETITKGFVSISNTSFISTPTADFQSFSMNFTHSLDVSLGMSVSMVDIVSTHIINSSHVIISSSIEDASLFPTTTDSSNATTPISSGPDSVLNVSSLRLTQHPDVTSALHLDASNSTEFVMTMTSEDTKTIMVTAPLSDFSSSSIQSDNTSSLLDTESLLASIQPTNTLNGSLIEMTSDVINATTPAINSIPTSSSISYETSPTLQSSLMSNFTGMPNTSTNSSPPSTVQIESTFSPTPISTQAHNTSLETTTVSSIPLSTVNPNVTSTDSFENVTSPSILPSTTNQNVTSESPESSSIPINTHISDSIVNKSTLSTLLTFNTSSDISVSAPTVSTFIEITPTLLTSRMSTLMDMSSLPSVNSSASGPIQVSLSTVNHTIFPSDSDYNMTSMITSTILISPTIPQTSFLQSSGITNPISMNMNASSEFVTMVPSDTTLMNVMNTTLTSTDPSTPGSIVMSESTPVTLFSSSDHNITTSSTITSIKTSMPSAFWDLNSTVLTDSLLTSPTEMLSSSQPNVSSMESPSIAANSTTITSPSLTERPSTSSIHTSDIIAPNQTSSLFSQTSTPLNSTLHSESTITPSNIIITSSVESENATTPILQTNTSLATSYSPISTVSLSLSSAFSGVSSTVDMSSSQNATITNETLILSFSTPLLSSTVTDITPISSTQDSMSSDNVTTYTSFIPSSPYIHETVSTLSITSSSELFINTTSTVSLSATMSLIPTSMESDIDISTIVLSSPSSFSTSMSIINSSFDTTVLSASLDPTPQITLTSSIQDTSSQYPNTVENNSTIGSDVTADTETPITSLADNTTMLPPPTLTSSIIPSHVPTDISQPLSSSSDSIVVSTSESSSNFSFSTTLESDVASTPSVKQSSTTTIISPTPASESSLVTPPSSSQPDLSSSLSSFTSSLSSSTPQPTSAPPPTGSTLPTIENSGHITSYWVSVGILVRTSVDVTTPEFKSELEQGLANAYALGRQRQEEIDNGTFESLGKKRRKRRSVASVSDPNVKVEVTSIQRTPDTTSVDVSHVLQQDGVLIPAEDATKQMALLNDMELAIQLKQVVNKGAQPYITPASSSDDDDTALIAGSASGAVAAIIIILLIIFCCCCGGNRCCTKRSSGEFTITDLSEKSQVVPTTAAENPSYYVDDESQGNVSMSVTSKKGKYTLADNESEMDETDKRRGRPMPPRRPPSGKKTAAEHQRTVSKADNEDANRRSSPKKRGKKKKEMDTDEAMEMRSIYESQIASLQESPTHSPEPTAPVDLVITGPPTVEMEEDLLENAEEERRKNKQRLREKRRKEKEQQSPIKEPPDEVDAVYETAQKEIDRVLGPRKEAEKARKKSRDKERRKKKEKSDDSGDNSQQEEGPPSESLEEAKAKIHRLLDDAFSLISQSRSSMGNKVHPTSQQSSVDKGSPRSQQSHRSHSSIEQADKDVGDPVPQEKQHTPLYVERSHGAYDRSGLISWSPYRASDDTHLISLPNTETNLNSVAPQGEPIKGTTVFSESLPSSLQPHYYTTLPGEPIVLRTKDLNSNQEPNHRNSDTINVKSTAVTDHEEVRGHIHRGHGDDLYTPYYGMSSYHELPPSSVVPNSPGGSYRDDGRNISKHNEDSYSTPNNGYSNNVNSINNDSNFDAGLKTHSVPGRGRESNGRDFVDVIKHSVEPGASPQPLIHSLREELMNLSRKKGISSSDSNNTLARRENGIDRMSKTDGKPPSGATSHGQDVYYRNNRNRHMKTDL